MQEFKKIIKMKTGGSVAKAVAAYEKKEERAEAGMHEDVKQDKKLVKKAINLHDDQLHEGKKTDLKTLKKGGRCKREGGTVTKYKCGGGVKKMADGGLTDMITANQAVGSPNTMPQNAMAAELLKRKKLAQLAAAAKGGMGAPAAGGMAQAPTAPVGQPMPQDIGAGAGPAVQPGSTTMKCGGKAKKKK